MRRSRFFIYIVILVLFCFPHLVLADIVVLKSGRTVKGEIIERSRDYIKILYEGKEIYYENKYIDSFKPNNMSLEERRIDLEKEESVSLKRGLELALAEKLKEAKQEFGRLYNYSEFALGVIKDLEDGYINKELAKFLFQCMLFIINEDYHSARVVLEKARQIDPDNPDINYNLGYIYYLLEDYNNASAYFLSALKQRPEDIEIYELIAKSYYNIGEIKKAKQILLIAREILAKRQDKEETERLSEIIQALENIYSESF